MRVPVLALAGARIDRIPATAATTFLARLRDATWTGDIALAVGAVTDGGELVGVAVLSPPAADWADAFVAVTPARRRLGIGTYLLLVLLDGAANRGMRGIACPLGADTRPAQWLSHSVGLSTRIVRSPRGADVIAIPIHPHRAVRSWT